MTSQARAPCAAGDTIHRMVQRIPGELLLLVCILSSGEPTTLQLTDKCNDEKYFKGYKKVIIHFSLQTSPHTVWCSCHRHRGVDGLFDAFKCFTHSVIWLSICFAPVGAINAPFGGCGPFQCVDFVM